MATLEPQKYVIVRTVWTGNILLVSGRLVLNKSCFLHPDYSRVNTSQYFILEASCAVI